MREAKRGGRLAAGALAATLLLGAGGLTACDNEDQKDVQEIGEETDKQIDNLDNDGKDD
ncbi:MAG: hypothetical protein M3198_13030 [Actinomycetota bacterium]|nr:hypothetical protein [Actinomycetota bacterium]